VPDDVDRAKNQRAGHMKNERVDESLVAGQELTAPV
jgi:hypothetical protein